MKFTFKKEKMRAFDRFRRTYIKFRKKEVGYINISTKNCKVFFAIKKTPTKEDPANFCWKRLKYTGKDEKTTREWLNQKAETITQIFDLYQFED